MQRLFSLALLAALLGGGWTVLQKVSPQQVQRAVETARGAVRNASLSGAASTGQPAQPPAYGAPGPTAPVFSPPPRSSQSPTIRIASFNIQTFGKSKASKPYVMQALAQIVRGFDVIAIQEIRTQDDRFIPNFLRDYVNTGGAVYDAKVSERLGRTSSTEQYAFIYNTATIVAHPTFCAVVPDPQDRLHREPFAALFRTTIVEPYKPFTFTLINTHTDPDEIPEELDALYYVYRQVQRSAIGQATEDDVILLGDLNTKVPASSPHRSNPSARPLSPRDLGLLAQVPGISPLIRQQATNTHGSRLHDNILIPSLATVEFTGRYGVLDMRTQLGYSLTKEQALMISDHQPVWGEFSAIEGGGYRTAARR